MRKVKTKIMFLLLCPVLMVNALPSSILGVKGGDWIWYDFQEIFSSGGDRWQTMEFLSVVGTKATIRVIVHMSPAIEINQTRTVDLSTDDNFLDTIFFGARVYLIPSDLGVGVPVYLGEFGNQTIAGESTGIVAGANRRLVYANFSKSGSLYTFYWDKQTGVLVEGTMTIDGTVYKAVSTGATNMWSGEFVWWPWILVIITIICGLIALRRNIAEKLRKKDVFSQNKKKEKLVRALSSIEFNSVSHLRTPRNSDHHQLSLRTQVVAGFVKLLRSIRKFQLLQV